MEVGKLYRVKFSHWLWADTDLNDELRRQGATCEKNELVMVISRPRRVPDVSFEVRRKGMMYVLLLRGEGLAQFWFKKRMNRFDLFYERVE